MTENRTEAGWIVRSYVLTDVVGSVGLWERDSAAMSAAMARHDALVAGEVTAAGGSLVRTKGEGDSTFSVFPAPLDAVVAAAAIQRAIADEPWPLVGELRVRAGVHTGESEARAGDWYGPAVNRAARLRGLAAGGQTLVSGVTAGLVADKLPTALRLMYRGRRALRGIERPEEVWELGPADDPRFAPVVTRSTHLKALPAPLTRLVGRTDELGRLARLIDDHRLVTITGPGGAGKTRLAVELAHRLAGQGVAIWYAELAPLRDADPLIDAITDAVGVEPGPDRLATLQRQAEQLDGVLILDNCEHILDACALLIERLLHAGPDLRVLATSREPLGLSGERAWPLAPLGVPGPAIQERSQLAAAEPADLQAVELLLDRAQAVRPGFEIGESEVASVVKICRALDGIPLAIELAASRLRSLSLESLASRLDDQVTLLSRSRSTGRSQGRHQSIRLAIDWSYDLLTAEQRVLAEDLSVFAGGFRLDALDAVSRVGDALDGVDELVARSMVEFDGTSARYRMLEPVRQCLAEHLEASGRSDAIQRNHAEWVAVLCGRLGRTLLQDPRSQSLRLREERSNIDVALRWAEHNDLTLATRIVGALGQYWLTYDRASGRRWCEPIVAASSGVPVRLRARALLAAGLVAGGERAFDRSVRRLREALSLYRAEQAPSGEAACLFWLGRELLPWGSVTGNNRVKDSRKCFEDALSILTRLGDDIGAGWCRIWLSIHAQWAGNLDQAEDLAARVVRDCIHTGVRHPLGQAWSCLGQIADRRGDDEEALAYLEKAATLYRELDDPWQLGDLLVELATYEATMARYTEAMRDLTEAVRLREQTNSQPNPFLLAVVANVHHARGETAMATGALGAYDATGHTSAWAPDDFRRPRTAVRTTRAALDPVAVAAAAEAAHGEPIAALLDRWISKPFADWASTGDIR